jgi:hypothetical protein
MMKKETEYRGSKRRLKSAKSLSLISNSKKKTKRERERLRVAKSSPSGVSKDRKRLISARRQTLRARKCIMSRSSSNAMGPTHGNAWSLTVR